MNVMVVGAHPDDCDIKSGGTAILLRQAGHRVRFVSVTNGNSGHQSMDRDELAVCRKREAADAARIAGIEYVVMDADDGHLEPAIEMRLKLMAQIRHFNPDVLITHRTCDYHADHRNTGLLVQDCSYLLMVPHACPEVPAMEKMPVILLMQDGFTRPAPYRRDLVVNIAEVFEQKLNMVLCHRSQVFDWLLWVERSPLLHAPENEKIVFWRENVKKRASGAAEICALSECYEISEYGSRILPEEFLAHCAFAAAPEGGGD